jgi:hypothetical protein
MTLSDIISVVATAILSVGGAGAVMVGRVCNTFATET